MFEIYLPEQRTIVAHYNGARWEAAAEESAVQCRMDKRVLGINRSSRNLKYMFSIVETGSKLSHTELDSSGGSGTNPASLLCQTQLNKSSLTFGRYCFTVIGADGVGMAG